MDLMDVQYVSCMQIGIQTRTVADLTAVANLVRSNNVPLLFVALLLLQFLSMVVDRSVYVSIISWFITVLVMSKFLASDVQFYQAFPCCSEVWEICVRVYFLVSCSQ